MQAKKVPSPISGRRQFPNARPFKRLSLKLHAPILAACFAIAVLLAPTSSSAGLYLSVTIAPPALPVYDQPPIPGEGYIWTPGYWAWDDDAGDYYWVPGVWVLAPEPGYLWTPGYWGWSDGIYVWNAGYWGPHVGFYGGVCYGFGYTGFGFYGGYWSGGSFFYNRSVTNISNTTIINNTYTKTVINNNVTNVSYNGGPGGLKAKATPQDAATAKDNHLAVTASQLQHQKVASQNKELFSKVNHGKPSIAAASKPGEFNGPGIAAAKKAGSVRSQAFTKAVTANKGLVNSKIRSPNKTFSRAANSGPNKPSGKRFDGKNRRTVNLNQSKPLFQNRSKPAFNRSMPSKTTFNAGRSRQFSNTKLGRRPPLHFQGGRPSPRMVTRGSPPPRGPNKHK